MGHKARTMNFQRLISVIRRGMLSNCTEFAISPPKLLITLDFKMKFYPVTYHGSQID